MLSKVISGGQSGCDQLGLKIARHCGFKTGGTAPKGWKTETGSQPKLADFGLVTCNSSDYGVRTELNVIDSDATVIFGKTDTAGFIKTVSSCKKFKKPYLSNPTAEQLINFVISRKVTVLNVAGNRGSKLTIEDRDRFGNIMLEAFTKLRKITI